MKILFSLLTCLCLNQWCHAQADPAKVEEQLNIVYTKLGNWEGKLDLYLPKNKKQNALVIYIHGGGWTHGNKEAEYEKIKVFIENGYAVANVAYRLAGQAPAPAAVEDVNSAIAFLLKNAAKYHFDQNKLVLMGASAGAHLALLAGLQSNKVLFPGTSKLQHFKVAAIISKYGPTDLLTWAPAMDPKSASAAWLGNSLSDKAFDHFRPLIIQKTPKFLCFLFMAIKIKPYL